MVAAAFERLRTGKHGRRVLVVLAVGLLLALVAVFSTLRGEEYKTEARTKTLVYEDSDNGGMGLYWLDDRANLIKATPEEIRRCEKAFPKEAVPVCRTTYYEKVEEEK